MVRLPFVLVPLTCLIGTAATAQTMETSSLARPEPEIPIIWLAPPPTNFAPEDQQLPIATLVIPPPPSPRSSALPQAARALLEQAMDKGSPEGFAAVEKLAREMYPDGGAQIDALAAKNAAKIAEKKAQVARAKADALAAASFLDNWKGELDLGGSYTSGIGDALAIYAAVKLNRDGVRWRQVFTARADYAKSDGTLSTDKDNVAYQLQYKIDDRLYTFGLLQFDRDEVLGFHYRFTEGAGVGYSVLPDKDLHLDLEAGPALQETNFIGLPNELRVAGRGSVNFLWKPNSNIQITEVSAVFFESDNANISSTAALDTKLFGPLKARLSYNLTYEKDTPTTSRSYETVTTASLVYSF